MLHRRCSYFQLGLSVARGDHMLFIISSKPRNCQRVSRVFTWENSHRREFHTARDDFLILYRVYMMTGSFHISLLEGTLHLGKIHLWFKIANVTHVLPVPVYRQTDFTLKRVVVSRLHDTVVRFRTGVNFSPQYNNRSELTPGWLAPVWHFVAVSNVEPWEEPEWTRSGAQVAPLSFKHPLSLSSEFISL